MEDTTLLEACDALRDHLQRWYDGRKAAGRIHPSELKAAKDEFMAARPECKQHEFDLYFDLVAVPNSYRGGCFCGDCDPVARGKVSGIVVEPYDWEKARSQAMHKYGTYAHTFDWDEHPEGYEDVCYCRSCRSYGD